MQQKERASNVPLYFDAMEAAVCKGLKLWSGLSESNRHLNLGKVPYYHYTKAAQRLSFYNMPARQPQAFPTPTGVGPNAAKARLVRKPGLSGRTSPPASGAGALRSG